MSISIRIGNVVKKYGGTTIIPDLSAFIKNGGFFALLGPSGCGKTTLLHTITGFNSIEGGTIKFDDRVTNDIPAWERDIGMVSQSYVIFPRLTVRQNVEYGLKVRKVPREYMREQVDKILGAAKIDEYQDRLLKRLSGGQQQRVALARAAIIHPQVLLMDDSLSNLDTKLRIEMRNAICNVRRQVGITTVYVTHDQEEALAISDRIVAMELRIVQRVGSPQDTYARPYNALASTFIGHSNLFLGTIRKQGSVPFVVFGGGYHVEMANLVDTVTEGQKAVISARPEGFLLNPEGMEHEIVSRTPPGRYTSYFLRFGDGMVLKDQSDIRYSRDLGHIGHIFSVGEKIRLKPNPNKINVFTQNTEQSLIKDVKRYGE